MQIEPVSKWVLFNQISCFASHYLKLYQYSTCSMMCNAPHLAVTKFLWFYLLERVPVFYTDWTRCKTGWNVENYQNKEILPRYLRNCRNSCHPPSLLSRFRHLVVVPESFHLIWMKADEWISWNMKNSVKCFNRNTRGPKETFNSEQAIDLHIVVCSLRISSSALSLNTWQKAQSHKFFYRSKEYSHYYKNGFGFRVSQRKWFGRQSTKR